MPFVNDPYRFFYFVGRLIHIGVRGIMRKFRQIESFGAGMDRLASDLNRCRSIVADKFPIPGIGMTLRISQDLARPIIRRWNRQLIDQLAQAAETAQCLRLFHRCREDRADSFY